MMYDPDTRISEFSHLFPLFAGADLELWGYGWSHLELHLLASLTSGEKADLCFLHTYFVDCPIQMRNARLRMPTAEETAQWASEWPESITSLLFDRSWEKIGWGRPADHCQLIIESESGLHRVIAGQLFLTWGAEPKRRFMDATLEELWPGGPSLSEL
ncbi:MAG: hypothetical protein ACK47B_25590 [Armatimonadota bacterium]